jgi:hypothetical protein
MRDRTQRRVVCAAIKKNQIIICGPRHFDPTMHDIIGEVFVHPSDAANAKQGFVDQKGIFMDRKEAFKVATEAGQILEKTGGQNSQELYSEDLY